MLSLSDRAVCALTYRSHRKGPLPAHLYVTAPTPQLRALKVSGVFGK